MSLQSGMPRVGVGECPSAPPPRPAPSCTGYADEFDGVGRPGRRSKSWHRVCWCGLNDDDLWAMVMVRMEDLFRQAPTCLLGCMLGEGGGEGRLLEDATTLQFAISAGTPSGTTFRVARQGALCL